MRQRDLEATINLIKKSITKLQEMDEKYSQRLKKDLEEVCLSVVDDWYSDYIPNSYRRKKNGLRKAYKVKVKGGEYSVDFSAGYMREKHRVSNEYIFENSFMKGWHGGADKANKGPVHPYPGTPMYREPWPYYTRWSYVAEWSEPPYEVMNERIDETVEKIGEDYDTEFEKDILSKIQASLNKLKGGN